MRLKNPVRDIRTISALLTGAEAEALATGDATPGAEHLLLSALALSDGSARRAFESVGADADQLRSAIAAQHAQALLAIGIDPASDGAIDLSTDDAPSARGVFRATASGQSAFQAAVALAKEHRGTRLVGAHVVVAVAQMEHGTAARTLRAMGVDRHTLATAGRRELEALRT